MIRFALTLSVMTAPAFADVSSALSQHILPGYARLADTTQTLAGAARADCDPVAVRPAFHDAYDAWIGVAHIQIGPIEDKALTLAMTFWPDPKDRTGKALARLTGPKDPVVDDPTEFETVSAAAQGFSALERLLYDPQTDSDYACRLTQAIATGLARKSAAMNADWPAFARLMDTAGEPGNTRFQSPGEAQKALYTTLITGLEFVQDQRLGRPLGSFDRPRPRRAEAYRSARSLRHITLSLKALEDLAAHVSDTNIPRTHTAFAKSRARAAKLNDPSLAGVDDPNARIRIEALQQTVRTIRTTVVGEIGIPLRISAGFNSLDGD